MNTKTIDFRDPTNDQIQDGDIYEAKFTTHKEGAFVTLELGHRATANGILLHEAELEFLLSELKALRNDTHFH